MLPKVMKQMEYVIKEELSTLDHIYITLDLWTNRNMASFLGMTVHFVDEKRTLKSFVLAVDSFAGRHTQTILQLLIIQSQANMIFGIG